MSDQELEQEKDVSSPEKLALGSLEPSWDLQAEVLRLFPEARTEGGKVDFERLRLALGGVVDTGKERYALTWPGKADCLRTIQMPSFGTLRPRVDESIDFHHTENVIIEGDNLEVLKLLQKSYLGAVKMIYIDPPYNTGNDFIYPDNYTESLGTYLAYTGQVDAGGRKFGTNTESDGRFHSKWLNMMYPRLYLARNLLREDGAIFVSISDHEVASLRLLMNEVFGEENFVAQLVWKSRKYPDSRAKTGVSTDHEYVVVYTRSDVGVLRGIERDESKFSNPDSDPRGAWMSRSLLGLATRAQRPNLHYVIVDPATGRPFTPPEDTGWRYEPDRMQRLIRDGCILFPAKPDGRPREKKFRADLQAEFVAFPSIVDDTFTADGTAEIRELFGEDIFEFPKPSTLLAKLLRQGAGTDGLILDFFAGSGSTAEATLELNKREGGRRRFILVQLPEPTGRADYPTIAAITKERVRRVVKRLQNEEAAELVLGTKLDFGFRVFQLAASNFKAWEGAASPEGKDLAQQLDLHVEHLVPDRTAADLLYEIVLRSGYPITAPIEQITLAGRVVHAVAGGVFLVCLERALTIELIRAMADRRPERVVCLDVGFADNDPLKVNAVQIFRDKGVTTFKTI